MSSTFIERSPEPDGDKSLILIMDGDGNVTTDPAHFERLISNQKIPNDMGIKIVRLDSSQGDNESDADPDSKQELKLTVEEIYPENIALAPGDQTVMSSPLEILPGPSNEHIGHDIVDPFSQMDPEQLQRLEHALASEQAKQILGENVAAMLDMLSVDDSPAAFLQNSIKNDHCYTNLLPSSDPNGPSFFLNDNRSEISRGKGKAKVGTPVKGKKVVTNTIATSGKIVKQVVREGQNVVKLPTKQATLMDFGLPVASHAKAEEKTNESTVDEDVNVEISEDDLEDEEEDDEEEDDNPSDEDYSNRSSRTKRKTRKYRKRAPNKRQSNAKPFGRLSVGRPVGRPGRRPATTPEIRARNEKLNDAMSKIVQSMDISPKESENKDVKKGTRRLKVKIKEEPVVEVEKVQKDTPKPPEEPVSPVKSQQPAKYPKRENRKPPAHLADAFGPALFSTPDIIRRVSASDEVPQTPPEKKNFTVGAHSKLPERGVVKSSPVKIENSPTTTTTTTAATTSTAPKPKPALKETPKQIKQEVNLKLEEEKPASPVSVKIDNKEIQKLIEKKQPKPTIYEDVDYSDDTVDEIYLDPSQMDQSLLEGFNTAAIKNEDQLLQEAIRLQEQFIDSNKGIVIPESTSPVSNPNPNRLAPESETIESIQNEITSAILVAQPESKPNVKPEPIDKKSMSKTVDNQSDDEKAESGALVVDEGREERRRNSAKRRRSDEVSDLDSDMDDALSEASWNSEDDPDRLWCICRKPHNNRFMICCDVCEEWFHGKCVGITKTIGKQMEQDGLEWSCPNCTKKKKTEEHDKEIEKIKLLKEKMAQSIKEQQQKIKETQKTKTQTGGGKDKSIKSPKSGSGSLKQTKISDFSQAASQGSEEEETVGRKCIMCKGPVRENSIYCSDDCIRKHSQHAISQLMADSNKKSGSESSPSQDDNSRGGTVGGQKISKEESRIVVMDSNSKKYLVGQSAPTIANLTTWLKENPSYHVVYKKTDKPGKVLVTSRKVVKIQPRPGGVEGQKVFVQTQKPSDSIKSTQLKLSVSPNSKQINILQPGGKKVVQIVNTATTTPGRNTKPTTFVVKQKSSSDVIETLPILKTVSKVVPVKKEVTTPTKTTPPSMERKEPTTIQKTGTTTQRKKREMKTGSFGKTEEVKEKEKKDTDQQIRDSVKKTLAETLKARVQECKDFELDEKHIEDLAVKIEEKLFKHFENKVDTKYKSKYRSLVFNIKDPKNETLYKKILDNSISPKELVKLSPEELASQELARWREKENQHQLEMIKKTELELMTKGNTYIMKSHKGEQLIESDQSEKVAAVAAEIDPNTPVQELVSAINSVTSTTQDINEEEEKNKKSETSLMKMKKEKERRRSRERKHDRREKSRRRSRSRSRSRTHHSKDKKRSRSREREKERSKSKHREKKGEKKEKEIKEEVVEEKVEEKTIKNEISTSEDAEVKPVVMKEEEDEEDRVPSSTVIIKTPEINEEEEEEENDEKGKGEEEKDGGTGGTGGTVNLWKGTIVMADVAKFTGFASEVSGDCSGLYVDVPEKVDVVGRIPFDTVWDYIARMKKMGTKDILVIQIQPVADEEKSAFSTLYNYLSKRSRIGVIGKTSDAVKDFYLYPLASHSSLPQVLLPLDGPPFQVQKENSILGIIVRNKHRSRHLGLENTQRAKRASVAEPENCSFVENQPDRSYTPPLPDKEQEELLKKARLKRKIRVRMEFKTSLNEEEVDVGMEDDDSPYSPGDSDEDLPPLPKIPKSSQSVLSSSSISKLLSPHVSTSSDGNLKDPVEIQKKIEEINRAIEEQTQQIQSLTSAVPSLAATAVLPTLPLLSSSVPSSLLTPSALSPKGFSVSSSSSTLSSAMKPALPVPPPSEKVQLPLLSESDSKSPSRSYTPPLKVEESIPFLPEVTSKISLPSNLQEILNSIQKKDSDVKESTKQPPPVEEILKADNPNIKSALSVLNSTKNLLPGLSEGKEETTKPLLSRLTDQELLAKVKEMEMEAEMIQSINPCPPQPLPPGVQDIPLLPFTNPPPPPSFFSTTTAAAGAAPTAEEKKPEKRKLDPKSVFDSDGVPDFNIPGSSWEERRSGKSKPFKIDIKLGCGNPVEKKPIDVDHFDIETISQIDERHPKTIEEDRIHPSKPDNRYRGSLEKDRRRSDDREWKYDRRQQHWDDGRRYKDDYRRHGRRDRPQKYRFDQRHLQKEWDGSIKNFEERQRWRNQPGRREEDMRRARRRADSSSN